MIGPLNGGLQQAQSAYVNPFQQNGNGNAQQQVADKKPEENKPQPKGAQAAGTQDSATSSKRDASGVTTGKSAQDFSLSGSSPQTSSSQSAATQPRGSLVDIMA